MFGPRIEGARVTLAPPAPEYAHVEDDLRWFRDPVVTRYLNLRNPQTREQHEEYRRLMARSETNEASRRALQRAGYRTVGRLRRHIYLEGAFHDVWLGEVVRDEWLAAAEETEDIGELA
ncbi:MAG: GNAT family N-acetyltransferase [Chloroflexota bacterium]|nr:GNAT family N-acetyltransferase [Chloroflexota bacterium]